ncbi:MAG: hypothetical protein COA79_17525 [Planctomycetota bacterium]|nr:MAG: hypothetical protein COA79_17525 [Planctomycetota bacterium]
MCSLLTEIAPVQIVEKAFDLNSQSKDRSELINKLLKFGLCYVHIHEIIEGIGSAISVLGGHNKISEFNNSMLNPYFDATLRKFNYNPISTFFKYYKKKLLNIIDTVS